MKKLSKILLGFLIGVILSYNHHFLYISNNSSSNLQLYVDIISSITFIIYSCFILYKTSIEKIDKLKIFFILLLDIFLLISNSFIKTSSLSFIYKNIIYNILIFILNYIILKRTLIYIENFIKNHKFNLKENKITKLFLEHPFIFSMCLMLIFWLIYVIAFYPIILSPDPSFQIKQFFNIKTKYADYAILLDNHVFLTNHHPVMHTLLLGGCLSLGRILINDNFGLFLFSFIQLILLSSILAYTIKYLKDNKVSNKICFIILIIYCLTPMFPLYALSGVKDTIYTCFVILYVLLIDKIIRNKEVTIKNLLLILVISILVALFRNNGIYVLILSFPLLIIYCKNYWKPLLLVFVSIIVIYGSYSKIILPYFKITDGSIREVLSIPFQQTARYVKYYSNDLSKKDIKTIDKVLEYDTLAKRYNPTISDPVKNGYNKYTTKKELLAYFKVWFKCFFKHPLVYIEATLNNIYGYFSPQATNWYVYYKYDTRITEDNLVNYHYNNLEALRNLLANYAKMFPYIPIIGLLCNIGFNTWLLIGLSIYSIIKKKSKYLIVLSPLLVTLLVCVASPVNTYFRYTMPYVFIMPCVFTLIVSRLKNNE